MAQITELTRTLLYSMCFLGLWFPILWFIGSILVAVQLRGAPSSGYKRSMMAFLILTPIMLVIYIIAMVSFGIAGQPYYHYYGLVAYYDNSPWVLYNAGLSAISGVFLVIYALFGCLFIMFADMTFRSNQGPVTSDLNSPLYLRGVHLGMNLAGMFLLMPLFQFIGIPLVLHKLRKIRAHSSALFATSNVFGILSFVTLVIIVLLLIIAGSLPDPYWHQYNNYYNHGYCKRAVLQNDTTAAIDMTTTIGNDTTIDSTWNWAPTRAASWASDMWTGWDTPPASDTMVYCADLAYREPYQYRSPYSALQRDPAAFITLIILTVLQWIFNFVFIGVADALILKAIGESGGKVVQTAGIVLVHPCPNCQAPLQFVRTGPATQVQCYKCSSVCEFQTA